MWIDIGRTRFIIVSDYGTWTKFPARALFPSGKFSPPLFEHTHINVYFTRVCLLVCARSATSTVTFSLHACNALVFSFHPRSIYIYISVFSSSTTVTLCTDCRYRAQSITNVSEPIAKKKIFIYSMSRW